MLAAFRALAGGALCTSASLRPATSRTAVPLPTATGVSTAPAASAAVLASGTRRRFASAEAPAASAAAAQGTTTATTTSSGTTATTHFGFEQVATEDKSGRVHEVFRRVAEKYDLMNDAMSAGVHRLWKDEFIRTLSPAPGTQLIDVAGGTGDIAFRYLDAVRASPLHKLKSRSGTTAPASSVVVYDINGAMLEVGKERARVRGYDKLQDPTISWMEGNAEDMAQVPSGSKDAYTIAFGIRNCTHVDAVLREAYRVLRPGGRFMCLEFSQVPNAALRQLYDLYSFYVIPELGRWFANDRDSYKYLVESIRQFPDQDRFAWMLQDAGFEHVLYKNLTFGVVAIHSGFKPRAA